jgi:hypothetical protein
VHAPVSMVGMVGVSKNMKLYFPGLY